MIVTLEFEFKTSTKVYSYLHKYINAGIKFRTASAMNLIKLKK